MTLPVVLFVLLAALAAGGFAYFLLQPSLERAKHAQGRLQQMKGAETDTTSRRQARDRVQEQVRRRRNIEASLEQLEKQQKAQDKLRTKVPLRRLIGQAGLTISVRAFVLISLGVGVVSTLVFMMIGIPPLLSIVAAPPLGFALPRWAIRFLIKRRTAKFVDEFANAIDVIVRGVRSGLPLNDTLRMVATEAQEPVRSEFQRIVEAQQMGMPISEAVERLYQNMPMSETNFFAIVIAIQSQAGGSLSEALGNLSRVLRDRKKMRAKVQALSAEAKTSAAIIGSLPFIVAGLVYLTTPDYIMLLFITSIGQIILVGAGLWMLIGIVVMKKMIAFDF